MQLLFWCIFLHFACFYINSPNWLSTGSGLNFVQFSETINQVKRYLDHYYLPQNIETLRYIFVFSCFSLKCFPDHLSHVPIMKCSMVRNKISSLDQFIKQSWGLWEVFIASNNRRIIIRNRGREMRAPLASSSLFGNNLCVFSSKMCIIFMKRFVLWISIDYSRQGWT